MQAPLELKTERLLLRPFRPRDVDDAFEVASDPEWARYLEGPQFRQDAERWVARQLLASWDTNPSWAIELSGRVIGNVALRIDETNESAEIKYAIGREHWGQGPAPEAVLVVMEWAYDERGLARIWARADVRNKRSWRVMEKLGMTREGVLRSHVRDRDGRANLAYYGLLREEWEASSDIGGI